MQEDLDLQRKDWLILLLATLILTPVSLLLAYVVLYVVTSLPLS